MNSLKPVIRRAGAVSIAAASAVLLTACSAGQITQTSSQVAAVNGASVQTEDGSVTVHDITLVLEDNGDAALKFTASNQDYDRHEHALKSATVNGKPVTMSTPEPMAYNCSIVGDSAAGLQNMPQAENACIEYVKTSVDNDNFAYGGNVPVTFTFDSGTVEAMATVAAPTAKSGESDRQPEQKH